MIKIYTIVVTPFQQNCRILHNTETDEIITLDPGGDVTFIVSVLKEKGLYSARYNYSKILLTHAHIDHGGGIADFIDLIRSDLSQEPELLFHEDNELYRSTLTIVASRYGLSEQEFKNVPEATRHLEDDEEFSFGRYNLKALFTPGHAPGHLAFYISDAEVSEEIIARGYQGPEVSFSGPLLLAGDTLFDGSIGRTDLPGGEHELLIESIANKLLVLPDDTLVLSGHGSNTSIGKERDSNPFLQ